MLSPDSEINGFKTEHFDGLAESEAGHFWFEARNRLINWAFDRYFKGARDFFELGCGNGFVLSSLAARHPELKLCASDAFVEGLEHAVRRVPQASFYQLDATKIPFENSFDALGAFDVLEHIDDDVAVLRQMFTTLRSGGGMLLTVPQHPCLWSAADDVACHKRRYTRQELMSKVRSAGFRIVRVTSFMTLTLPLFVLSRLPQRKAHNAGELRPPALINAVLSRVLDVEQYFIQRGLDLPVGGSLLVVASRS